MLLIATTIQTLAITITITIIAIIITILTILLLFGLQANEFMQCKTELHTQTQTTQCNNNYSQLTTQSNKLHHTQYTCTLKHTHTHTLLNTVAPQLCSSSFDHDTHLSDSSQQQQLKSGICNVLIEWKRIQAEERSKRATQYYSQQQRKQHKLSSQLQNYLHFAPTDTFSLAPFSRSRLWPIELTSKRIPLLKHIQKQP